VGDPTEEGYTLREGRHPQKKDTYLEKGNTHSGGTHSKEGVTLTGQGHTPRGVRRHLKT